MFFLCTFFFRLFFLDFSPEAALDTLGKIDPCISHEIQPPVTTVRNKKIPQTLIPKSATIRLPPINNNSFPHINTLPATGNSHHISSYYISNIGLKFPFLNVCIFDVAIRVLLELLSTHTLFSPSVVSHLVIHLASFSVF